MRATDHPFEAGKIRYTWLLGSIWLLSMLDYTSVIFMGLFNAEACLSQETELNKRIRDEIASGHPSELGPAFLFPPEYHVHTEGGWFQSLNKTQGSICLRNLPSSSGEKRSIQKRAIDQYKVT